MEEKQRDYDRPREISDERETVDVDSKDVEPRTDLEKARLRRDERAEPARAQTYVSSSPDLWAGMRDCRHRFDELQAEFIEEPRAAVEKAERLIGDAVNNMMTVMQDRIKSIHTDYEGDHKDTERLRLAMRSYRELMDSLLDRSAA